MQNSKIIRSYGNKNEPIVDIRDATLPRSYFNLVKLEKGETFSTCIQGYESCWVMQEGLCDIEVGGETFSSVGDRKNIWESCFADSVYAPPAAVVKVTATEKSVIAVAGGACASEHKPFRIKPGDVEVVEVGSLDTHSRRRIHHILKANDKRKGNLLVSELYADPGCWSGYPPHKHGDDIGGKGHWSETGFEEIYHYRFNPETGFGAQFNYYESISDAVVEKTQNGDTFLIPGGYHPTVTSPGHSEYIFTILVGHTQSSLVQNFEETHRHLLDKSPGVKDMVAHFTGEK